MSIGLLCVLLMIETISSGNWSYISDEFDYTDSLIEYMKKLVEKTNRYNN